MIREYIKILGEEKAAKEKEFDGVSILEALAATGLRSVRYLKEIDKNSPPQIESKITQETIPNNTPQK